VVGVVTLRDLLVPVLADGPVLTTGPFHRHEHQLTAFWVHELMRAEPVTARAKWPLAQAVLAMEEAGINRLPVIDSAGRPAGILTRDDVLRVLARRIRRPGRGVSSARLWQRTSFRRRCQRVPYGPYPIGRTT
jgi:CBS-domain-containing membrane protein